MSFAGLPFWAVAGLIAGSAGLLALLHLLRIQPQPMRVVTLLFWQHAVEKTQARSLLHRFRHPLTYALLLAILSLIALALGKPELDDAATQTTKHVYVLSAGASMQAVNSRDPQPRFDLARRALLDDLRAISKREPVAVVVADPWPRVIHPFDDPRPMLADRVEGINPADLPATDEQALAMAAHLVSGSDNADIVLVTDSAFASQPASVAGTPVRTIPVGGPVANAAVIAAQYEPDANKPLVGTFRARVVRHAAEPGNVRVRIERAGGSPLLDESRRLEAGAESSFIVDGLKPDGDTLTVEIIADDALATDNRAQFRLPLRRPIRVALPAETPKALRLALTSVPYVVAVSPEAEADVRVALDPIAHAASGPTIVVASGTQPVASGLRVRPADSPAITEGLDFEGGMCGAGGTLTELSERAEPLLLADRAVLAAYVPDDDAPQLILSRALFAEGATLDRRAALAVLFVRGVHRLAGWEPAPIVIPPERYLADPLIAERFREDTRVQVMPAGRRSADLTVDAHADEPQRATSRWHWPEPFELLLLLAVVLACIEASLHARGRIP